VLAATDDLINRVCVSPSFRVPCQIIIFSSIHRESFTINSSIQIHASQLYVQHALIHSRRPAFEIVDSVHAFCSVQQFNTTTASLFTVAATPTWPSSRLRFLNRAKRSTPRRIHFPSFQSIIHSFKIHSRSQSLVNLSILLHFHFQLRRRRVNAVASIN
jgi:hypothetical protein